MVRLLICNLKKHVGAISKYRTSMESPFGVHTLIWISWSLLIVIFDNLIQIARPKLNCELNFEL